MVAIVVVPRSFSLKAEAKQARTRHQSVPVATKVKPSRRKAGTFAGADGSMNCGRKARKNNATFGLSTFVRMPWRKAAAVSVPVKREGRCRRPGELRRAHIPRKTRYAPPINFTALKAQTDVARKAERPS